MLTIKFKIYTKDKALFTGLLDGEGVEIYEGDILEFREKERVVVYWDDSIAGFTADFIYYEYLGWNEIVVDHIEDLKVIGNKFHNPDLIP